MSAILNSLMRKMNLKPVTCVMVGLFGTFFSEEDEFEFDTANTTLVDVAKEVRKRYGDGAFGFRRCYYLHGEQHFTDKGWVYLSGEINRKDDVFARNLESESILRGNMEYNHINAVLKTNGRFFPFAKDDIVLDFLK